MSNELFCEDLVDDAPFFDKENFNGAFVSVSEYYSVFADTHPKITDKFLFERPNVAALGTKGLERFFDGTARFR